MEGVVPVDSSRFYLEDPPEHVVNTLATELRYLVDTYNETKWVHLYDRDDHSAPIGLLPRAREALECDLNVTWEGDRRGEPVDVGWDFDGELRGYQETAVTEGLGGGIIALPTGTGKTVVAMRIFHEAGEDVGRPIVLVHTQELLYQWKDELESTLGADVGIIGDGNWSEGDVTVALMQTLMSRGTGKLDGDYGIAVFDECHRTGAAEVMYEIGMELSVALRIGLSATPWRRISGEELKIEAAIGGEAHSVTAEEMINKGYLARPEFDIITHDGPMPPEKMDYNDAYHKYITTNDPRNDAIADRARELAAAGHKTFIAVSRIAHGEALAERLHGSAFIHGGNSTETRQQALNDFETGDLDILISTLLGEGVDIPAMTAVIVAHAGRSKVRQIQTIGRALRPLDDTAVVVDVEDTGEFFASQFDDRMQAMAEYYGVYGPDVEVEDETLEPPESLTAEEPTFDEVFDL